LARRHPDLWLIEAHPGDGQYDCLWLCTNNGTRREPYDDLCVIGVNLPGSIHVEPWCSRPDGGWADVIDIGVKATARHLEAAVGLDSPTRAPPTTRRTLTYRAVAGLISVLALDDEDGSWDVRSGYHDTSGYGGVVRDHLFESFPAAAERLRVAHPDDLLDIPAYRFWFITRREQPVLAVETAGTAWTPTGDTVDLMAAYNQAGRNLATVVDRLTASALEA
ncbi:MAG: hypothetical protein KDB36_04135, partial [Acidimicrobiales bacterium]|nr:hypothetical protein [Acidimicrobiales bacterium]